MSDADQDNVIRYLDAHWPDWREDVPADQWDALYANIRGRWYYQWWQAGDNVSASLKSLHAGVSRHFREQRERER